VFTGGRLILNFFFFPPAVEFGLIAWPSMTETGIAGFLIASLSEEEESFDVLKGKLWFCIATDGGR
jgi:hypothetical protein